MKKSVLTALVLTLALLVSFVPALTASATQYSLGDVTGDGKVTSADARQILRFSARLEYITKICQQAADVNRSGKVNSADARTVLRVAARLETLAVGPGDVFDDGLAKNAKDPANEEALKYFFDGLGNGRFSLVGTMTSNGETDPIEFSKADDMIRMSTEMSGVRLSILSSGGILYLISDEKQSYIELDERIMKMLGLDLSALSLDFGEGDAGAVGWAEREYEGKSVESAVSESPNGVVEFYADGGKIVLIRVFDETGACDSEIRVDSFRSDVTKAELELPADYKITTYTSFILGLATA
ncbi:MAG: dockerin type I repeat-containing protein [Clostridia bacterium]|nr:dockerin type I repeat-containing protein [Clostridia bacterium]